MGLAEICQERMRLLQEFSRTARAYADQVREMADLTIMGLHSEVEVVRRRCRAAWDKLEKARIALYRHEADHQCDLAQSFSPQS